MNLEKARDWLSDKTNIVIPVDVVRGHAMYCAYIYKIIRPGKTSLYYCVDMQNSWTIKQIKRICV